MAALTIGPATVIAISCHGFSGMLRNAAMPPMGQQGDALNLHAKTLGHNTMPQFVQRDAGEDRTEHCHRPAGASRASVLEPAVGDERQKDQKGHVQPQRDPEYTPN